MRAGLALSVMLVAAACYRPNVLDGGFKCATKTGVKQCPDGLSCYDGICRKMPLDGGSSEDRGIVDGTDATETVDRPEVPPDCFRPKENCEPADAAARCDPWCQSGCTGCKEKCSANTLGDLTCNTIVSGTVRNELQTCTLVSAGTAAQSDACAPGLVCLEDACTGGGSGRCYRFCRSDADCPNSQCNRMQPSGWKVCDVPNVETCNPITPGSVGCPSGQGCYIAISRPTHTVCDCPGAGLANEFCSGSRSCFPGLLCVDPNGGTDTICLKVCDLTRNGADCPGGIQGSCHMYSGNTGGADGGAMFNTKFGFCF